MSMENKLHIVMPAYNEQETIQTFGELDVYE